MSDQVITLCPYFKISPDHVDDFKKNFAACVDSVAAEPACAFWGFSYGDDNTAFCREGYADAAGVLAHIANVGPALDRMMQGKWAEVTSCTVMGPAGELEKLKEPLAAFNPVYYTMAHSFRAEAGALDKNDTCVTLCPTFQLAEDGATAFKALWAETAEAVKTEEDCLFYGFFYSEAEAGDTDTDNKNKNKAFCREGYADAAGVLTHVGNVGTALQRVTEEKLAEIIDLKVHTMSFEFE